MTTPPIMTINDELLSELVEIASRDTAIRVTVKADDLRALLQHVRELKADAERYRLFAETVVAECSGAEMTPQQRKLFGCMNSVSSVTMDELAAMFDAARSSAD